MVGLSIFLALVGAPIWSKSYDRATFNDSAFSIVYDMEYDAYVVVGHTDNGPLGGIDVLVTKLNASDGSIIWTKVYGGTAGEGFDDYGRSIIIDYGDTNYYAITGYTCCYQMPAPNKDVLVFKIRSSDGSLVWGNRYAGSFSIGQDIYLDDYGYSLVKDATNGSYIIAGNVEPGPGGGLSDAMVMSVDSKTGIARWSWAHGKTAMEGMIFGDEYLYSIIEDSSMLPCTSFVVAGKTSIKEIQTTDILVFKGRKSSGIIDPTNPFLFDYIPPFGSPGHSACAYSIKNDRPTPGYILAGDLDTAVIVMKLFPNLFVGWGGKCRTYTIPAVANSRCIELTSDGNYVIVGATKPGIPGPFDFSITKIDQTGKVIWSKVLTGCYPNTWMNQDDYGQYVIEEPSGFYASVGYTDWPSNFGTTNLLVTRTDQNGYIPCSASDTCLKDVEFLLDSPLVYKDSAYVEWLLKMDNYPIMEADVVIKDTLICRCEVGVEEQDCSCNRGIYNVSNLPNPYIYNTSICYSLSKGNNVRISIYNLGGQLVRNLVDRRMPAGSYASAWDGRDNNGTMLTPGIYFYTISSGRTKVTKKMTMIR